MPQSGDPNPPRWSAEESFLELLTDTLESMDRTSRGQFLQRFFRSIAQVDLGETESLDLWDQALARRRELSESLGKRVALQAALVDVLATTGQLRLPILMEYQELRKLQINAATDPLTSLYNRRFFEDYFEKELNRSNRYSHKLALVIFDLHRFKEVNDRFGHPQGDALLQMAAATLRKSLRTSDYAFRIGGDEFALLLPQSDTEQAAALSRRLRAAYASSIEPLNLRIPLALDFGLAVYPEDGELQEVLIRVADERLYQLKNGTRSSPPDAPAVETSRPAVDPETKVKLEPAPRPPVAPAAPAEPQKTGPQQRRWERVSLENTHAYALIGDGVERTARVIDLGYGGVALETSRPEDFGDTFHAVLHVPILPPVRVSLNRVYQKQASTGTTRIGCSFVT
ncbi:MAG TPA: GGDEF domain-containing protein [Candidatus Acidoferrales bacterium]|jgi:diguanylate cyclase (GGDEF)-like protein|nr:GGDEF domain-containing protein [Candidatus Acidoferrales bacterium]